ncbi:8289_t:CDS:2 [Rhizophagus irregularis]|nr:8289_t:CDS:2 [Rhizophagus irregularis]
MAFFRKYLKLRCLYKRKKDYVKKDKPVAEKGKRWAFRRVNGAEFDQAEAKRTKLIKSKKIGPEFAEKRHSEAIYTSRPLSALISKCTSIYSSSTISFVQNYSTTLNSNYISAELGFDINTESLSSQDLNSTIQNFSTALESNYISAELELDIDIESSTIQNFSTSLKKRRNGVLETHDNSENSNTKRIRAYVQKLYVM